MKGWRRYFIGTIDYNRPPIVFYLNEIFLFELVTQLLLLSWIKNNTKFIMIRRMCMHIYTHQRNAIWNQKSANRIVHEKWLLRWTLSFHSRYELEILLFSSSMFENSLRRINDESVGWTCIRWPACCSCLWSNVRTSKMIAWGSLKAISHFKYHDIASLAATDE